MLTGSEGTMSAAQPSMHWIRDGEKYAALGLDVKTAGDVQAGLLSPRLQLIGHGSIPVSEHWQEWLGTIRTEEITGCGLFVAATMPSKQPGVLDGETKFLQKRVWDFYVGLLLTSLFSPAHAPFILSGSYDNGEFSVREKSDIDTPVPNMATPYPEVIKWDLETAALRASHLEAIAGAKMPGGLWRLNRVLSLYVSTRAIPDIPERIHQFARCVDGLLLLQQGEGKKQFRSRSELFIGPRDHELMGAIYDIRGNVEHLHENRILEVFDRDKRLELAKQELMIEYIARTALARIIDDPKLWPHFANSAALAAFWKLLPADCQSLWGEIIDPRSALEHFEPKYISDATLGAP
jgi:hypothetical protein